MKLFQLILLISMMVFIAGVFAENSLDNQSITFNDSNMKLEDLNKDSKDNESKLKPRNPNKEFEEESNPILGWAIIITLFILIFYVYRYFIRT